VLPQCLVVQARVDTGHAWRVVSSSSASRERPEREVVGADEMALERDRQRLGLGPHAPALQRGHRSGDLMDAAIEGAIELARLVVVVQRHLPASAAVAAAKHDAPLVASVLPVDQDHGVRAAGRALHELGAAVGSPSRSGEPGEQIPDRGHALGLPYLAAARRRRQPADERERVILSIVTLTADGGRRRTTDIGRADAGRSAHGRDDRGGIPIPDFDTVWNPPRRTRRERMLDRLQVAGAVLIATALVAAAAVALL